MYILWKCVHFAGQLYSMVTNYCGVPLRSAVYCNS